MAERLRYVRTSADAGGDGTTDTDSSGDGSHAYDSLANAEAGEQADLVTAGDTVRIVCSVGSGSAADTSQANFDDASWTTDATNDITVEAKSGEEATSEYSATNYRMEVNLGFAAVLIVDDNFVTVRNIQIKNTATSNHPRGIQADGTSAMDLDVEACYLESATSGLSAGTSAGIRINNNNASSTYRYWNCVVEGFADGLNCAFTHAEVIVYNLTVVNPVTSGIDFGSIGGSSTLRAKNLILENGTGSAWESTSPGTTDYVDVFVDDTSSPTSDNSKSFTYASATDFKNATDSDAVDAGTDLSGDSALSFSDDINDVTRSTWDCGAGEFVGAGGLAAAVFAYHHNYHNLR